MATHSSPILVLFAVPDEARPFRRLAPANAILVISGMGRIRARRALDAALDQHRPRMVLTCGFAGGLNPRWRTGDVLGDADPAFPLVAGFPGAGVQPAAIHCADRVAVLASEKAELFRQTGADAVEMESGEIRTRCRALGLPAATLRVISDEAGTDLPVDFNQLLDAHQQLSLVRLGWHVATHPGILPGLLRLQRSCALASTRLADSLHRLLTSEAPGTHG